MTETARRHRTAIIAVLLMVGVSVSVGGAAVAFWGGTGTGAGVAASGTTAALSLTAGTVSGDLYPGGTATATTSATNTNTGDVRIVSISLDTAQGSGGFTITGDQPSGGCSPSSFTFTTQSPNADVAAGATTAISLPGAISMATSAANACQGATVTVFLKAGT